MSILAIEGLDAAHGLLLALRSVSFELKEGEILGLVGANGAGKSTLLRTIAGVHRAKSGRIVFDGAELGDLPAHRRVGLGIALVPEGRRLFPGLTVEENLRIGAVSGRAGPWNIAAVLQAFPQLEPLRGVKAIHLSGGQQQATAIGRALMANPRLLLLDELSLGLSPKAVDSVYASLCSLIESHTTIILVEQDLQRTLKVAHQVVCLLEGRVVAQGRSADMTRDQVMRHYFGVQERASTEGLATAWA